MAQQETGAVSSPAGNRAGGLRPGRLISIAFRAAMSLLAGSPFVVAGVLLMVDSEFSPWAARGILLVGLLIVFGGMYLSVVGTHPRLDLLPGERTLALRHPSMKPAYARIILSLPFFAGAGYLLWFTNLPYIYPFLPFVAALYLYFRGVVRYWINHHTSYFVTDRRVARMYRFAWLDTTEIPVNSVNSISEARSLVEIMTGRGSVVVASGIGSRHKVQIQEIDDPGPVARTIRELVG